MQVGEKRGKQAGKDIQPTTIEKKIVIRRRANRAFCQELLAPQYCARATPEERCRASSGKEQPGLALQSGGLRIYPKTFS